MSSLLGLVLLMGFILKHDIMKKHFTILFLFVFVLSFHVSQAQIEVLTGTEHGTYYQLAKDMNELMPSTTLVKNQDTADVAFLDVRTTAGSSINFDLIVDKDNTSKVGFMQLDFLLLKKMEDMLYNTDYTKNLIVLMPMNVEDIHLIAKEGSDITSLATLQGKKVVIGNKMEGTYSTTTYMQNVSEVIWRNNNMGTQDALMPLLLDKIDAFFVVATPPVDMLKVLPKNMGDKFKLVSLENVNGWADAYIPSTIAGGVYNWQKTDVSTFGVPSVVVVNTAKLSEEEKQQLIQWRATVIENLENLKTTGHPAWKTATVSEWDTSIWPQL